MNDERTCPVIQLTILIPLPDGFQAYVDDRAMQIAQVFVILCVTGGHPVQTFQARISFEALFGTHTWLFTTEEVPETKTAERRSKCVGCICPEKSCTAYFAPRQSPWMHYYVGAYVIAAAQSAWTFEL